MMTQYSQTYNILSCYIEATEQDSLDECILYFLCTHMDRTGACRGSLPTDTRDIYLDIKETKPLPRYLEFNRNLKGNKFDKDERYYLADRRPLLIDATSDTSVVRNTASNQIYDFCLCFLRPLHF